MGLYDRIANSHPKLAAGRVYCTICGRRAQVNAAECLRTGWPKCCGYTMRLGEAS